MWTGIDVAAFAISEARVRLLGGRVREYEESPILVKRGDNMLARLSLATLGRQGRARGCPTRAGLQPWARYGVFWNRITDEALDCTVGHGT